MTSVARVMPMFPLGSVLFPYSAMPLHVFEPRYRALTRVCLDGDRRFGVVLIERGFEVGGGDTRFGVGTVAEIVQARELPDGRFLLATVGTRRLRVQEWLPDDPYPQAVVTELVDTPGVADGSAVANVARLLTRVHALRAELGAPAWSGEPPLAPDPVRASFEAAALAGLGPLDAQALLEIDDTAERLARLEALLAEHVELLGFRLSG